MPKTMVFDSIRNDLGPLQTIKRHRVAEREHTTSYHLRRTVRVTHLRVSCLFTGFLASRETAQTVQISCKLAQSALAVL